MTAKENPWIIEATQDTFQEAVVERSRESLVLVDFWADWCQPCRLLTPILERMAKEFAGSFVLAKAEAEKMPSIAAGFGVQSIPAVYALRDGQLLDYFVGVLPEPQLRAWIERLLPTPAEQLVAEARSLEAADPQAAEAKYREATDLDANLASARIGLAALLLGQGRADESRAIIDELEKRGFLEPEAEKIKAQLDLNLQAQDAGNVEQARAALAADPTNLDQKFKLAEALAAAGQYEEALQTSLELLQGDRKRFGEPARKLMVDIFHLLPDDSELTSTYRRKLSTALY